MSGRRGMACRVARRSVLFTSKSIRTSHWSGSATSEPTTYAPAGPGPPHHVHMSNRMFMHTCTHMSTHVCMPVCAAVVHTYALAHIKPADSKRMATLKSRLKAATFAMTIQHATALFDLEVLEEYPQVPSTIAMAFIVMASKSTRRCHLP